jgi:multidrug transporter EmrE-like cation transporter
MVRGFVGGFIFGPATSGATPLTGPAAMLGVGRQEIRPMNVSTLLQLAASTAIYVLAAGSAKSWALAPNLAKIALTLALYTLGNLIMLRLVRAFGMSAAFSLTAVIQLVAINAVAILVFGEKLGRIEGIGVALAIVSVMLITLGPALSGP